MFPLSWHLYFELAAFLASLMFWKSIAKSKLIWFVPYLLLIVCVELTARYLYYELRQPNAWLYNLSVPIEYCFFASLFLFYTKSRLFRKMLRSFIAIFFVYSVYSIIFITSLKFFNRDLLVVGGFFMIIFSVTYIVELYRQDHEYNIWSLPMFWICLGTLLFNLGGFSRDLLGWFSSKDAFANTIRILRGINHGLNYVLYSCIIIAFICQKIFGTYRRESADM